MAQSVNCVAIKSRNAPEVFESTVIHLNVRVVHAADIAHDYVSLMELPGELIHRLVAALANG